MPVQRRGVEPKWKLGWRREEFMASFLEGHWKCIFRGEVYLTRRGKFKWKVGRERINGFIFSRCQSSLASCPGSTTCQLKLNWEESLIKRLIVTQSPISRGKSITCAGCFFFGIWSSLFCQQNIDICNRVIFRPHVLSELIFLWIFTLYI